MKKEGLFIRDRLCLQINGPVYTHMSHLHTLPQFHWASLMKALCVCLCASIGVLLLLKYGKRDGEIYKTQMLV